MNRREKKALVRGDVVIVGVDVGKKKHWARIYNNEGLDVLSSFGIKNTKEDFQCLESKIARAQKQESASRVVIGMEPTGHYWKPLAWYLWERGYQLVAVNPYHVKQSKEIEDNSPSKTDRKDAGLIADLVWQGKFQHCILLEGDYAELRNLSVARSRQIKNLNSALNQLRAILDEYFPEYQAVFKYLTGNASLWVLRNVPFPKDVLKLNKEELIFSLKAATSNRVGEKRAEKLIKAAKNSIGLEVGLTGARTRL